MKNKLSGVMILSISLSAFPASAQIAAGGAYRLEQSVIAGGGGESLGGNYKTEGTSGQPAAGLLLTGNSYRLIGGFWTPLPLAPTAAGVTVGGRVVGEKDAGIKDAILTLTGGTLTAPRVARTNNFGQFAFSHVETGHFYVLSVQHRKYGFAQDAQTLMLLDARDDVIFRADWEN